MKHIRSPWRVLMGGRSRQLKPAVGELGQSCNSLVKMAYVVYFVTVVMVLRTSSSQTPKKHEAASKISNTGKGWKTLRTSRLPTSENDEVDYRLLPLIGNGNLAYIPYTSFVTLAGVYAGSGNESRRAQIKISSFNLGSLKPKAYELNIEQGFFQEEIELDDHDITAHVRWYAHADPRLRNVLVQEVEFRRGDTFHVPTKLRLTPVFLETSMRDDVSLNCQEDEHGGIKRCEGVVSTGQGASVRPKSIFMVYTFPYYLVMSQGEDKKTFQYVTVVDTDKSEVDKSYRLTNSLKVNRTLRKLHQTVWLERWNRARISLDGNAGLASLASKSLYDLFSTLPYSGEDDGVAYEGSGKGRMTSELDVWVLPVALLFEPEKAKCLLQYRINRLSAAKKLSRTLGREGAKFPWESAETGDDVTSEECHLCPQSTKTCLACNEVNEFADHVTSDVALAAIKYLFATEDRNWLLNENGLELLRETAKYFLSRVQKNGESYSLIDVTAPDVYGKNFQVRKVNNSLYTNIGASLVIKNAQYASCLVGRSNETGILDDSWMDIANKLKLPIDDKNEIFQPYEGYSELQGEAERRLYIPGPLMIDYPLTFNITPHIRRNNLDHYESWLTTESPIFAHASVAMSWIGLDELDKASASLFTETGFAKGPFKIWTDTKTKTFRRSNYISGAAAYLSTLLFGYIGIRFKLDRLEVHPRCTPDTNVIKVTGLYYMGGRFNLELSGCKQGIATVWLKLTNDSRGRSFHVQINQGGRSTVDLKPGNMQYFNQNSFSIFPGSNELQKQCKPPDPSHGGKPAMSLPTAASTKASAGCEKSTNLVRILSAICIVYRFVNVLHGNS